MKLLKKLYEPHVLSARSRLETDPALRRLLEPSIKPAVLERFLIEWLSRAPYLTEPVEGWILRTGERCRELGMDAIGQAILTHAKSEAGHHLMTMEDTHSLVEHWNARRTPPLDARALLSQPPTETMKAYRRLHDEVIAGPRPMGQVAIEREIGFLAVTFGARLLGHVERVLGLETAARLTFLAEHVAVDVGHTRLNEKLLEEALTHEPAYARDYAEAGAQALVTYIRFLGDCLHTSEDLLSPLRHVA